MNETTTIAQDELTHEERLELALAESRSREASLAAAIAQRSVTDTSASLEAIRQRIARAALARRASAAAVPAAPPNRAERRRGRKA